MNYNHEKFMQDVAEGRERIARSDEWINFAECKVTNGIYNKIPLANGQIKYEHIADVTKHYEFAVNFANDKIRINGKCYAVAYDWEFTIKILKTKIKAQGGARGLMEFLARPEWARIWMPKIIENCKPTR